MRTYTVHVYLRLTGVLDCLVVSLMRTCSARVGEGMPRPPLLPITELSDENLKHQVNDKFIPSLIKKVSLTPSV